MARSTPTDDPRRARAAEIEAALNGEWNRFRADAWKVVEATSLVSADPAAMFEQLSATRERAIAALRADADEAWGRAVRDVILLLSDEELQRWPPLRGWLAW